MIPKNPNFLSVLAQFLKNLRLLYYLLVGTYIDKVKNFCDHSITLRGMTDNLLTTGHFWTTSASFRVKLYFWALKNRTIDVLVLNRGIWLGGSAKNCDHGYTPGQIVFILYSNVLKIPDKVCSTLLNSRLPSWFNLGNCSQNFGNIYEPQWKSSFKAHFDNRIYDIHCGS